MKKFIIAAALCVVLSGCSIKDFKDAPCLEKLAATEASITRSYSMTKKLYDDGAISIEKKNIAVKIIDGANVLADNALPLCKIGSPDAVDYIMQANIAIQDVAQIIGE